MRNLEANREAEEGKAGAQDFFLIYVYEIIDLTISFFVLRLLEIIYEIFC